MDKDSFIKVVEEGYRCVNCAHFNKDSVGYLQCNNLQYIEITEDLSMKLLLGEDNGQS
jgi:hypothetical protein